MNGSAACWAPAGKVPRVQQVTNVLFPPSLQAAYDGRVKPSKLVPADVVARLFLAVAAALSASSAVLALPSILGGDFGQGLLLVGVAVFAGWMAMAIHQFQQRL